MDQTIHVFGIKILTFISVFMIITDVRFWILNRKKAGYPAIVPMIYRNFSSEIMFFKNICGDTYLSAFPGKSDSIQQYLTKGNLPLKVTDVAGAQIFWALLLSITSGGFIIAANLSLSLFLIGVGIAIFVGWLLPEVAIQNVAEDRKKSLRREIPFSIDLITAAMASGLDFTAAVRYYIENVSGTPLSHEYAVTLKYLELGHSKNDALKAMASRIDLPEFSSMVNAVVQGTEMGASIVETLKINAEEIRRVRMESAEQTAQRAPSLMMLPMLLFIMPAVFIVIFMPIYLKMQQSGFSEMF